MGKATAAAYGIRLTGLGSEGWLGVTGAGHWPQLSCRRAGIHDAPPVRLDVEALELQVCGDLPHSDLVHPLLGRIATHLALARGVEVMHAGAVVGRAGAWGVLGCKGAGKSTLLAGLAQAGVPVVTDDVLMFKERRALAGPRCIDLRPDLNRFGLGVAVRPEDPRNRISLPPIAAEHSLAGLVHLEWSEGEACIERLHAREALRRLLRVQGEKGYPRSPGVLLDLAALPAVCLRRPRSLSGLSASVGLMARLLSAADGSGGRSLAVPAHAAG